VIKKRKYIYRSSAKRLPFSFAVQIVPGKSPWFYWTHDRATNLHFFGRASVNQQVQEAIFMSIAANVLLNRSASVAFFMISDNVH